MQRGIRAHLIAGLFVLLNAAAAFAQQFPSTLPANSVFGRLGVGSGPGQAIPFSVLETHLIDPKWGVVGNDIYNSNSGNVGIGTATPSRKLDVVGTSNFTGAAGFAAIAVTGGSITGMPTPSAASDVAIKSYVDGLIAFINTGSQSVTCDVTKVTGTLTTTASSGSVTLTGANFQTADIGKLIILPAAGVAGADYIGTISARASTTAITVTPAVGSSVAGVSKTVAYGTNTNTAMQAAIAAAATARKPLVIPGGTCAITGLTVSSPMTITGNGVSTAAALDQTTLAIFSLSAHALTFAAQLSNISNLSISYLGTASSRTGYGIVIGAYSRNHFWDIAVDKHAIGIYDQGNSLYDRVTSSSNASYGWVFDGAAAAALGGFLGEIQLLDCQANSNGGSGYRFVSSIVGVFAKRITAASNTGYGIETAGSAGAGINDFYFTNLELASNTLGGVYLTSTGASFSFLGGLIEQNATGWAIRTASTVTDVTIANVSILNGDNGIWLASQNNSIGSLTMTNVTTNHIILDSGSTLTSITGVTTRVNATNGINALAGSGVFTAVGNYFTATNKITGTVAATSRGVGNIAVADF